MLGIYTHALIALVVNLFLAWDETVLVSECDDVNGDGLTVKAHPGVATTPASS